MQHQEDFITRILEKNEILSYLAMSLNLIMTSLFHILFGTEILFLSPIMKMKEDRANGFWCGWKTEKRISILSLLNRLRCIFSVARWDLFRMEHLRYVAFDMLYLKTDSLSFEEFIAGILSKKENGDYYLVSKKQESECVHDRHRRLMETSF